MPARRMAGPCDVGMLYWTTNSNIPSCGADYRFAKSSMVCQQALTQLQGAGSYTDTFAQYRTGKGKDSGKWKWDNLDLDDPDHDVECKADFGKHGGGTDPATNPYPRSGSHMFHEQPVHE